MALVLAGAVGLMGAAIPAAAASATPPTRAPSSAMLALLATLHDPAATAPDVFGSSVSVSGTTAIVGAYGTEQLQGAAYGYVKGDAGWPAAPTMTLHDPAATAFDVFGSSLSVSGTTAVVGAPGTRLSAGAAYVYARSTAGWPVTPTVTLRDPRATAFDAFGTSVSVSGTTAVVGAPRTGISPGAVYVYVKGEAGWPATPTMTLHDPAATKSDSFGFSVAVSGTTVLVGAYGTSSAAGAAYAYVKGATGWPAMPTMTLRDPRGRATDYFGFSVAVSGTTAVVSAVPDQSPGVAYVYVKAADVWPARPTASLSDPARTTNDTYGESVAVFANLALVGAPVTHTRVAGAAYGYVKGTTWPASPTVRLLNPAAAAETFFGGSVAVAGTAAVVGAPSSRGVAYIYKM